MPHSLKIHTDSTACIGHCQRRGNGTRMRHLEAAELWIQQVFKEGRVELCKVNGKLNPADLYTKHLPRSDLVRHIGMLGFQLLDDKGNESGNKNWEEAWPEGVDEGEEMPEAKDVELTAIFEDMTKAKTSEFISFVDDQG